MRNARIELLMDTRRANFKPRLCHLLNFTNTHRTFHRGFSGVTMKEKELWKQNY